MRKLFSVSIFVYLQHNIYVPIQQLENMCFECKYITDKTIIANILVALCIYLNIWYICLSIIIFLTTGSEKQQNKIIRCNLKAKRLNIPHYS